MKVLLDTHTWIWFITDDEHLSETAKTIIMSRTSECYVSVASLWEFTIKQSLGKIQLNTDLSTLYAIIRKSNFLILPIEITDLITLQGLSFHHRDPFDRLMIASAINRKITILSNDALFKAYPISVLW